MRRRGATPSRKNYPIWKFASGDPGRLADIEYLAFMHPDLGRPSSDQRETAEMPGLAAPEVAGKPLCRALISAGVRRRFGDLAPAKVNCRRRTILVRYPVGAHDRRRRCARPRRACASPAQLRVEELPPVEGSAQAKGLQCVPGHRGPQERMQGAPR